MLLVSVLLIEVTSLPKASTHTTPISCSTGSGSQVWAAPHPIGPWKSTGIDINPKVGPFFGKHRVVKAQENAVFVVPAKPGSGKEDTIVYTGDLWDSAPDRLKSHDLQYWEPLQFNDTVSPAIIAELKGEDWIELDV